jgi:hypothetical protein
MIVLLLLAQVTVAENKLSFVKGGENQVMLRLTNTDPIAGMQFTINARGIVLKSLEGNDRAASSALSVYQYLKEGTTLNVVILAPVGSSLPPGDGFIGRIVIESDPTALGDTCELFLTKTEICSQTAISLGVTVSRLAWQHSEHPGEPQSDFSLEPNYPNPFNPSTTIAYRIERGAHVTLSVYDITGRQIETLVDCYQEVGLYHVRWNADGVSARRLASGMYIARLQVDGRSSARTMNYTK